MQSVPLTQALFSQCNSHQKLICQLSSSPKIPTQHSGAGSGSESGIGARLPSDSASLADSIELDDDCELIESSSGGPGRTPGWVWQYFDKIPDPDHPKKYMKHSNRADRVCKGCKRSAQGITPEAAKKHLALNCPASLEKNPELKQELHRVRAVVFAPTAKPSATSRFAQEAVAVKRKADNGINFPREPTGPYASSPSDSQ